MASEIPGSEKIVFRSGAVDGGKLFSVDKKHIVALAPPAVLILKNRHGHANEVAMSGGFHPDVIIFSVEIFLRIYGRVVIRLPLIPSTFIWRGPGVLGVKIHGVGGKIFMHGLIVDVEIERINGFASLVGHRDTGSLAERHGEKRVQGLIRGHGQGDRLKLKIVAQAEAEEIAD